MKASPTEDSNDFMSHNVIFLNSLSVYPSMKSDKAFSDQYINEKVASTFSNLLCRVWHFSLSLCCYSNST
jgi:hypothetical protein